MQASAELVRSLVRWAIAIVSSEDSGDKRIPGPRLSQFCLGNMMCRTDTQTSVAIAREIAAIERRGSSEEYLESLVACIRASWGAVPVERTRRGAREGSIARARDLLSALQRFGTEEDRRLLELCSVATSWKKTELYFPGRVWQSLRDDFSRVGNTFYNKEKMTVDAVAEYIAQIALKR